MRLSPLPLALLVAGAAACPAHAFTITINPGAGLSANQTALAAFDRAAALWEARITDPITIFINADLAPLGPGIIGDTSSTMLLGDNFAELRDAMVLDALTTGGDAIVQALPTFSQLSVLLPAGRSVRDTLYATQANLKALGFTGLEAVSGHPEDAVIRFSSEFSFDFDNRDGVDFFRYDFETAAAHEIGHALGFLSSVDDLDFTTAQEYPSVILTTLDLFRFRRGKGLDPATATEFTFFPRSLVPGEDEHFDDTLHDWSFATGINAGDGNQASHWKNDDLTGVFIGLMDPTLAYGAIERPTDADFRALDVIGYDLAPEPTAGALLAAGGLALALTRRLRSGRVSAESLSE